ncbi:DUF459 domain-containing protein [Conchiformibius steedae DSM 2580]|uniref:DUF459 domain-containing protein n=1 Tax=Conchiformibius steedae DSM 2580 TaxID=1121352 RepID=A0AAE9HX79_9NEIS|nr:DUF459 domain-containing protein [Conchiformibius steedae]URD68042.1 DUF459 domain-containing protein [Conchiformibius steedae DSM 2580]
MLTSDDNGQAKTVLFPAKRRRNKRYSFAKRLLWLYFVLMSVAWLTIWFAQKSISAYWQQTYHTDSPFLALETIPLWRAGGQLQDSLNGAYDNLRNGFSEQNTQWVAQWRVPEAPKPVHTVKTKKPAKPEVDKLYPTHQAEEAAAATPAASAPAPKPAATADKTILLAPGNKVLFAGDSMLQGVAPHLQKTLKSQHQIDSLNLSKQSTGLAYPKFFDWPATIEQHLAEDDTIKLLVVLIGANDPWDFPNPDNPAAKYLKFESQEWEEEYAKRVARIVAAADKAGAKIVWLGVPRMKREKLDKQMIYVNQVLARALKDKYPHVLWLETADWLSDHSGEYQDSITVEGETVRVRSKDGIHFTTQGQQLVADFIERQLSYQQ